MNLPSFKKQIPKLKSIRITKKQFPIILAVLVVGVSLISYARAVLNTPSGLSTTSSTINVSEYANLTNAISSIGGNRVDLLIDNATILTANTTIPSNINLLVSAKGTINQGTYTLTINGSFSAPSQQVFLGTGSVTGLGMKEVRPEWWGANPLADVDSTSALQAAINCAGNSGTVKLSASNSPGANGYKITAGLVVPHDDFKLISEGKNEYGPRIFTVTPDITMILVKGFGFRMEGVVLWGDGSATQYGSNLGLVIDRSSLGDAETYANLDSEIFYNGFIYLKEGVHVRGRNVFQYYNIYSNCKKGIVIQVHTYNGGTQSAQCRGHRIENNRFHSMGNPIYTSEAGGGIAWASRTSDDRDSWSIDAPIENDAYFGNVISENMTDFSMGFYHGQLQNMDIENNHAFSIAGPMISTGDPSTSRNTTMDSAQFATTIISGNDFRGRVSSNRGALADSAKNEEPENAFYISKHSNIKFSNNTASRSRKEGALFVSSGHVDVTNNTITDANFARQDHGLALPAISAASLSGRNFFEGNKVRSTYGAGSVNGYNYGLYVTQSGVDENAKTVVSDNDMQPGDAGDVYTSGIFSGTTLGGYSLWVDGTGKLRINNGSPASDTAGTVVGAQ